MYSLLGTTNLHTTHVTGALMYSLLGTPTPQLPSCGTALATNTLSPGTRSEYSHSEYTHSSMSPYTGYRTTRPPTDPPTHPPTHQPTYQRTTSGP